MSSRIFYEAKSKKDIDCRFSLYGMGVCGSLGRLLAALIQYECRPNHRVFKGDIKTTIEDFLDCFLNEVKGISSIDKNDIPMLKHQILAYAWDWGRYWGGGEKGLEERRLF